MSKRFLCWFGIHSWRLFDCSPTGYATMSWAATPTREWCSVDQCSRCGKCRYRPGIRFCDQRLNPEAYNERGWPINADGTEMEIEA